MVPHGLKSLFIVCVFLANPWLSLKLTFEQFQYCCVVVVDYFTVSLLAKQNDSFVQTQKPKIFKTVCKRAQDLLFENQGPLLFKTYKIRYSFTRFFNLL